jgi:hypothetical protein
MNVDHRDDSDTTFNLMVTARANVLYHSAQRSKWSKWDNRAKIALSLISAASAAPLIAGVPVWVAGAGFVSAMLGAFVVSMRMDLKAVMHAELAVEYVSHLHAFECMYDRGQYLGLKDARAAFCETEKRETSREGAPDEEVFRWAEKRARKEKGDTAVVPAA